MGHRTLTMDHDPWFSWTGVTEAPEMDRIAILVPTSSLLTIKTSLIDLVSFNFSYFDFTEEDVHRFSYTTR